VEIEFSKDGVPLYVRILHEAEVSVDTGFRIPPILIEIGAAVNEADKKQFNTCTTEPIKLRVHVEAEKLELTIVSEA
jgi:hypothetical protein